MMGALQEQANGGGELFPDAGYAQVDPTGRYGRYNEVLGKGSTKTVYRAFDEQRGMEVAWNEVQAHDFLRSPGELERLYGEVRLLRSLRHPAVMRLHASWADAPRRAVCFVTELFTSGTLRQYRRAHPRASPAAVRGWCRQILAGLAYLHARGVIHRDLKCDNIFINGSQGQVKIGDLGLAAVRRPGEPPARCVVGTPEFMAPEVYAEDYDQLADVYSFGMCVLEMVTLEFPYSECHHPVQIYKKVTSGIKPMAFYKVKDPAVRRFIEKCLAPATRRPTAAELLNDPFLQAEGDGFHAAGDGADYNAMYNYLHQPACLDDHHQAAGSSGSTASNGGGGGDDESETNEDDDDGSSVFQGIDQVFNEQDDDDDDEHVAGVGVAIKGKRMEDGSIFLRLSIADKDGTGRVRKIYFPFDADADTALSVATELVAELDITDHEVTHIAEMIDGEVGALLLHWSPGPGMDDNDGGDDEDHEAGPGAPGGCQNCRPGSASSSGSLADYVSAAAGARRGCRCGAELHGRFEEITFRADEEPAQFQSSGCSSSDDGGGGQAEQCAAGEEGKPVDSNGVAQDGNAESSKQP